MPLIKAKMPLIKPKKPLMIDPPLDVQREESEVEGQGEDVGQGGQDG